MLSTARSRSSTACPSNAERMRANLELTRAALLPAGPARAGRSGGLGDEAYGVVQELAQRAWDEGAPPARAARTDERSAGLDLRADLRLRHYVRYAPEIVGRLDEIA